MSDLERVRNGSKLHHAMVMSDSQNSMILKDVGKPSSVLSDMTIREGIKTYAIGQRFLF